MLGLTLLQMALLPSHSEAEWGLKETKSGDQEVVRQSVR